MNNSTFSVPYHFGVLGVSESDSLTRIKYMYRVRIRQRAPYRWSDDAQLRAEFDATNLAYAVLSDPEKRELYLKLLSLVRSRAHLREYTWDWPSEPLVILAKERGCI